MDEKFKGGRFSNKEIDFIRRNVTKLSLEDISRSINRSESAIKVICIKEGIPIADDSISEKVTENAISNELKRSPEWAVLEQELMPDELEYFSDQYAKLISQFKGDVYHSEAMQIFHLIKIDILMNRNLRGAKRALEDAKRIEKELTNIYTQFDVTKDTKKQEYAVVLEQELAAARSVQHTKSTEYVKLQDKYSAINKELKATREQRVTRFENSKKDYISLLKALQEEEFREQEGKQNELVKLATEKEFKRLGNFHTYTDGTVDRPILSTETIKMGEDE